jgi:hypothetical protein
MVTVTTVRADDRVYYPVHVVPYSSAQHLRRGRMTRGSHQLRYRGRSGGQGPGRGFVFRVVCADRVHGDQDGFRGDLAHAGLPFAWHSGHAAVAERTARSRTPRWTPPAP